MSQTWSIETHTLAVHVEPPADVAEYRSPKGRNPMAPRGVTIDYDLTGRYLPVVRIVGERLEKRAFGPRSSQVVRRLRGKFDLDAAPEWLRKLVADNDPGTCCTRVSS